jgi:hypothetical protein
MYNRSAVIFWCWYLDLIPSKGLQKSATDGPCLFLYGQWVMTFSHIFKLLKKIREESYVLTSKLQKMQISMSINYVLFCGYPATPVVYMLACCFHSTGTQFSNATETPWPLKPEVFNQWLDKESLLLILKKGWYHSSVIQIHCFRNIFRNS